MFFCRDLTPLQGAVMAGDAALLARLIAQKADLTVCDKLGFNPLELSQLLGKRSCQRLLGGSEPAAIMLQRKSEQQPNPVPLADFEKIFDLTYRPYPTFASYAMLRRTIADCPYVLRCAWLAKDNYAWTVRYKQPLAAAALADVSIKWIDEQMGYGLFAEADIAYGAFIGEYTGLVRRLVRLQHDQNAYCLHYPTRFWSLWYMAVDALHEGNVTRFINHSDKPNIEPLCLVDRGLLRQVFVALRPIKKGEQLTFNYGSDYWLKRRKQ